nr:hypothetical protein [Tanacetum cinerariifolium]
AADYGHIKWIKDLVPREMWIQQPIDYNKHALWGVSHWGRKRKQFYGYAVNRESARDIYKFKEGDFKRLRLQDIEDMLLLLRRVEDLQLGVESYQKKLNLTRPDTDGTLNDVRNALNDRLKGIRMQYLPSTIWRKGEKDRAAAMIQAIEKMLKTSRIMRSLEKFVGGRLDSEEIENFINDDSIPIGVENSPFNMEEDIFFLEGLLSEDPSLSPPMIQNQTKSSIEEPEHSFSMRYENFSTTLVTKEVAESSTKNLVPIPRESEVTSNNKSESIEPVKDDSSVFTTFSNPLLDDDKINSDELNSHVESNSVESTSNHDTVKIDNLDEFSGPLISIHIAEEERIRREHADYINRMEMLFTINPRPHPLVNANINVESLSSLPIPVQDSDSQQEEIDIVISTDDVLPPGVENDDSDGEVDVVDDLRVDNSISNFKHEYSESEESDFDNPSVPLPPPEPPDEELDFEIDFGNEILVVRNTIMEFECIDARVKFDVSNDENDDLSYFMFVISAKTHQSQMPLYSQLEGTRSSVDTSEGSAGA